MRLGFCASLTALFLHVGASDGSAAQPQAPRPAFTVPTLTDIRDILSRLEAPIIATIVQRFSLLADSSLYTGQKSQLFTFLNQQELLAQGLGRYAYGTLEYPFTFAGPPADVTTRTAQFPPGQFHQDSFSGNANISAFYTQTFVPLLQPVTNVSFFFHLSSNTSKPDAQDTDATLAVDVSLLQLLSHRAHIGKIVAESKFAASVDQYTPLIKAQNASAIRTLLTNTTQETQVLSQADTAASALSSAWIAAGALVPSSFETAVRAAAQKVFRELIDITTEIEIQYLLQRLK